MKYSEFEKEMKNLGLVTQNCHDDVLLVRSEGNVCLNVNKKEPYVMDNSRNSFANLDDSIKKVVFDKAVSLASTPIEEREEEKRYRLRANLPALNRTGTIYLSENKVTKTRILDGTVIHDGYKTIFTESELEHIDETGFIREEVTE